MSTEATGAMGRDKNFDPIQVSRSILCQDATPTPVISPKASVPVTPLLFTCPPGAVILVFRPSATAWYGENATLDGTGTGKGYKIASANADTVVPCRGMTGVYIRAASATITVDFFFELLSGSTVS